MTAWTPNATAPLWYEGGQGENSHGPFFEALSMEHVKQVGPSCVATTLSMVANATGANTSPEDFKAVTNSQAPHTWSEALKPYGLQLAYCNNDVRRLAYFVDELVAYDDLFWLTVTTRSSTSWWITVSSHPMLGMSTPARRGWPHGRESPTPRKVTRSTGK